MKQFRIFFYLFLMASLCLFFPSCNKKASQSDRTIRIAIQPSAAFIPLYISRYTNSLETALKEINVKVEWQDFESGPAINESLFADLSDIGLIGDVPSVVALEKSNRMKLVGIPARGPNAYAMLARKDDTLINSYKDLKGRKVATVFGSTGHNFTQKILEKAGISFGDIEFCNIVASEAEQALTSRAVDAIVIWEPNVTRIVDKNIGKIIAQGDMIDLQGTNGFIVREEYLAENSDIISILLKDYEDSAFHINNLTIDIKGKLANALKIAPDQIIPIAQKYDYSVGITKRDVASLQDTIQFLVNIKNISSEYSVENAIDSNYYSK